MGKFLHVWTRNIKKFSWEIKFEDQRERKPETYTFPREGKDLQMKRHLIWKVRFWLFPTSCCLWNSKWCFSTPECFSFLSWMVPHHWYTIYKGRLCLLNRTQDEKENKSLGQSSSQWNQDTHWGHITGDTSSLRGRETLGSGRPAANGGSSAACGRRQMERVLSIPAAGPSNTFLPKSLQQSLMSVKGGKTSHKGGW